MSKDAWQETQGKTTIWTKHLPEKLEHQNSSKLWKTLLRNHKININLDYANIDSTVEYRHKTQLMFGIFENLIYKLSVNIVDLSIRSMDFPENAIFRTFFGREFALRLEIPPHLSERASKANSLKTLRSNNGRTVV